MTERDQELIYHAADRMYDAIRELLRSEPSDKLDRGIAVLHCRLAADGYDQAIEQLGPSQYVRQPPDVSRN